MKTKYIIISFVILLAFGCSKSEINEPREFTRCFSVKDLNTNMPIFDARVNLQEKLESVILGGYLFRAFASGNTNVLGEVCITWSSKDNGKIDNIATFAEGYRHFDFINPPTNYSEIYLIPITD